MNASRIELLNKYILEEPNNPFNKYALAMEYYEWQPEVALDHLNQLIKQFPEYLPAYFKTAHLLWDFEEWDKANSIFTQGIALAEKQNDEKALHELKAAYQNFEIDRE